MSILQSTTFEGVFQHQRSGRSYAYKVSCCVAVNRQGWESMHLRGKVCCGDHAREITVLGHVDPAHPESSFLGREAAVAQDFVALACERDVAQASHAAACRPRPLAASFSSSDNVR
jgi:hypothetical protein